MANMQFANSALIWNFFSLIFGLASLALVIFLLVFWVLMFIDVLQNKKLKDVDKAIWAIGILFFGPLAIVYYFTARKRNAPVKKRNTRKK